MNNGRNPELTMHATAITPGFLLIAFLKLCRSLAAR
jgi:hypothetical protein